jgi:3-oxoacyl-[acyl-carrier-protein] synthase II
MTTVRRGVVTGMGVVSAGGTDLHSFWTTLASGRSCVRSIERFDASGFPTRIAAEIADFEAERLADVPHDLARHGRIAAYASVAAARALEDSRLLEEPFARDRVGVLVATGLGTYDHAELFGPFLAPREELGARLRASLLPDSAARRTPGSISTSLARFYGFRGPVMSVMTACAGGTQALGDALRWIRLGRADVVLAGASDSELYPMGLLSFSLLGALSRRNDAPETASRPFDATRDGFVIGEGAGFLVLEERERALARGVKIWAEVAGFGSACDAYRVTDPHPDGTGAARAMRRALADAGVGPDDVGYVNAHGTSTPANDRVETRALKAVFGERAAQVPVSSTKSMIGHLTVAAGAVEAIATALVLDHQVVHPTANLSTPDPECDLDYVPGRARAVPVDVALSNSFAFGGQTASLVLRRA